MKLFCFALTILAGFIHADGFKVLGVLPFGSNSHFAIGHAIMTNLIKAGHEVTVISMYPQKKPVENYRDINVKDILDKREKEQEFNAFAMHNAPVPIVLPILFKMGSDLVNEVMVHPEVQNLLKSNEKFDVCIIEIFNADAFLGFADHYDCILITYTTFGAVKWINDMTSNEMPASYVPHPFKHFTDKMNFLERLENTYTGLVETFMYNGFHLPHQRRLYEKYFPNAKRGFYEMYKSSAIIFMNNHVSSATARPYLPNMIEIGGIHVEPAKPLPKDIQEFIDSAEHGVILFSMGSIIKAVHWPEEQREALVKAFGKLKQKVLWKYENETLPNKPDNVMIGSWIPQRDIVAHPNVKLFITHGGLLGTTEALVEGVPVIGLPIYGDQKMNMAKAANRGYGIKIDLNDVTEESITEALNEMLSNPKYKQNAEEISKRFVDRPMTPQDTVVYWIEYAVRHQGAPHLKAAGNDLNFIEFNLIDVYLTLAVIGLVILYINIKLLQLILRKIFKKKTSQDKKRK